MSKEVKKVKVFFDETAHYQEMAKAYEVAAVYKAAKQELETILEKTIDNPIEFRSDVLGYSLAAIKDKYPAAFNLNLGLDKTLQMLSIDLRKLERYDGILKSTPSKINVCSKTGEATADLDENPFCWFAETPEQLDRLQFAQSLADLLEQAQHYKQGTAKANLTNGVNHIVYYHTQSQKIIPNHYFVMGKS